MPGQPALSRAFRSTAFLFLSLAFFHLASAQDQTTTAYEKARSLAFTEQYSEAKRILRGILDLYPLNTDARTLYGRVFAWSGEYESALVQYDSVLIINPDDFDAKFGTAQVYAWTEMHEKALVLLGELREMHPSSPDLTLFRAHVYLWSGQPEMAYPLYAQALELDAASEEALRGLARSSVQSGRYEAGIEWYRKVLTRNPNDPEARNEIVRLSYRSTHEIQMIGSFESFLQAGYSNHGIAGLEYYYAFSSATKSYLHVTTISKFGKTDVRIGAGTYHSLTHDISLWAYVLTTPGADVAPNLDALADVTISPSWWELLFGYRYMRFAGTDIHTAIPGLSVYAQDGLWCTVRGYFSRSNTAGSTRSATATIYYKPHPLATFRVGIFAGNEAFRATTIDEISSYDAAGLFLAAKQRFTNLLAIDGSYQYSQRDPGSSSHMLTITMILLF